MAGEREYSIKFGRCFNLMNINISDAESVSDYQSVI